MIMKPHTPFARLFGPAARVGGVGYPARQIKPARREPALTTSSVKSARAAVPEKAPAARFSHLANMSRAAIGGLSEWGEQARLARIVREIGDDI